jgi:hypothetical protein
MRRSLLVVLAAALLSACGSSTSPDNPSGGTTTSTDTPTTIQDLVIGGGPNFTGLAQRCQLTATATQQDGSVAAVTAITSWSSSDTTVAVITSSGVLTTIKPGTARITALYSGFTSGIDITVAPVTTTFQGTVAAGGGQSGTFTLVVKGATNTTDTSTTSQVTGSIRVGANTYAVTGVFQALTGVVTLSASDATLRFGSTTIVDGVVSGSFTQGSASGSFSSTTVSTTTP